MTLLYTTPCKYLHTIVLSAKHDSKSNMTICTLSVNIDVRLWPSLSCELETKEKVSNSCIKFVLGAGEGEIHSGMCCIYVG